MPSFAYSAINAQGSELTGEIQATDLSAARDALRGNGLLAQWVEELKAPAAKGKGTFEKGVKPKSLQVFSRQFATMIEAGLSVVTALVILEQQTDDDALRTVIDDIREQVETGALLSEAMAKHPDVFSRLYIAMVEAGEAAGVLDTVLDRVAIQIEKEQQIKRRVKGAMIYPTVVLVVRDARDDGHADVPRPDLRQDLRPARRRAADADAVRALCVERAAPLLVPGDSDSRRRVHRDRRGRRHLLLPRWKKTESGRAKWDAIKLRMPVSIGSVVLKVSMARWSRTLSTLIASGVDIMRALEITAQTSGNWVVENETENLRLRVQEGASISQPLIDSDDLPADGLADGEDRRGDRRAREDALEGRGLLRGRGRRVDPGAHVDRRAADDGRRRRAWSA